MLHRRPGRLGPALRSSHPGQGTQSPRRSLVCLDAVKASVPVPLGLRAPAPTCPWEPHLEHASLIGGQGDAHGVQSALCRSVHFEILASRWQISTAPLDVMPCTLVSCAALCWFLVDSAPFGLQEPVSSVVDWLTELIIYVASICPAFRHSQQEGLKCVIAAVLEVLHCSEISCCMAFAFQCRAAPCNRSLFHLASMVPALWTALSQFPCPAARESNKPWANHGVQSQFEDMQQPAPPQASLDVHHSQPH